MANRAQISEKTMNQKSLPIGKLTSQRLLSVPRASFVAFFTIFSLNFPNLALAQEKVLHTLTVTGEGTQRISATLAQVELGVEIQAKTASEVQQALAEQMSAVVDLLRSRQVEQLQTTGITLRPNYDYSNQEQRLIGYIGRNTVSFRIDADAVGSLLDEAVKAGATQIENISFSASESAIAAAQKQALRQATEDAQQQADAVLSSLNLTRKDIVSIQIDRATAPPQPLVFSDKQASLEAANTPAIAGEQAVKASVTLQVGY